VTWNSSDVAIVTISNTAGSNGLATSLASGTTGTVTINAIDTANNISGTSAIYVTVPQSIAVTPANPHMAISTAHQFTATAELLLSSGTTTTMQNLTSSPSMSWSSSDNTVATVANAAGAAIGNGLVTAGTITGQTTLTATDLVSNISGTTLLTVTSAPVESITVTEFSPTPSIPIGQTQRFIATGHYADGSTPDFTSSVTWHSSNTGIATIDNTGLATAVAVGTVTITATDPITNISGNMTLTVQ
jgi:uncharacterized protein YjdB